MKNYHHPSFQGVFEKGRDEAEGANKQEKEERDRKKGKK